jgi:hypothetical protein
VDEQAEMAKPVTRGELREELGKLETRFDRKLELWGGALGLRIQQLEQRFDGLEQRFDGLEQRFDGLERRFDGLEQRFDGLERRFDAFEKHIKRFEQQMHADFARWAKVIHESLMQAVGVFDDKYKDLPGRVGKLERKVFAPKRTPRR